MPRAPAMAGRTGLVVSWLNDQYVHVPVRQITSGSKRLDLEGESGRLLVHRAA